MVGSPLLLDYRSDPKVSNNVSTGKFKRLPQRPQKGRKVREEIKERKENLLAFIDFTCDLHSAQTTHIFRDAAVEGFGDALPVL